MNDWVHSDLIDWAEWVENRLRQCGLWYSGSSSINGINVPRNKSWKASVPNIGAPRHVSLIYGALHNIPDDYGAVIELHYVYRISDRSAAITLEMSRDKYRARLRRAKTWVAEWVVKHRNDKKQLNL